MAGVGAESGERIVVGKVKRQILFSVLFLTSIALAVKVGYSYAPPSGDVYLTVNPIIQTSPSSHGTNLWPVGSYIGYTNNIITQTVQIFFQQIQ
jgi:hypothetical protein